MWPQSVHAPQPGRAEAKGEDAEYKRWKREVWVRRVVGESTVVRLKRDRVREDEGKGPIRTMTEEEREFHRLNTSCGTCVS